MSLQKDCIIHSEQIFRFGRVPSLQTITEVKKGEELLSHYKVMRNCLHQLDLKLNWLVFSFLFLQYDTALAPTWYQEAWARFMDLDSY